MAISLTHSITTADIRRVFTMIAADLEMIVRSTGVTDTADGTISDFVADFQALAGAGYLSVINVLLREDSKTLYASKYLISRQANSWSCARPGGDDWPYRPAAEIKFIIEYTPLWAGKTSAEQAEFKRQLKIAWTPTAIDIGFGDMVNTATRMYASNGFGAERKSFRR